LATCKIGTSDESATLPQPPRCNERESICEAKHLHSLFEPRLTSLCCMDKKRLASATLLCFIFVLCCITCVRTHPPLYLSFSAVGDVDRASLHPGTVLQLAIQVAWGAMLCQSLGVGWTAYRTDATSRQCYSAIAGFGSYGTHVRRVSQRVAKRQRSVKAFLASQDGKKLEV
jgi:hypothetical protein